MDTDGPSDVAVEAVVAFASAFCAGLFVGVTMTLFVRVFASPLLFGGTLAVASGCIEVMKLCIRRECGARQIAVLAAADAAGIFAGIALTVLLFSFLS